jgi:ATP phosphoribosyltransferase
VTGWDLVCESERALETLIDLEFGRCRLVVAAHDGSGVSSLDDLAGTPRVATVFPKLTRQFFERRGQAVEIVPMSGSAEIAPHLGIADIIVDLTSTGSTLRVNGLTEMGTILESTARLIAAPGLLGPRKGIGGQGAIVRPPGAERAGRAAVGSALESGTRAGQSSGLDAGRRAATTRSDPAAIELEPAMNSPKSRALEELVAALASVLRARGKRYVMANVPRASLELVKSVLPGLNGPTVVDILNGQAMVAVHAVVEANAIYRTIANLKALGAEGILVTRIERLMP